MLLEKSTPRKKILTPRAGSTANTMSRNIFRRQYEYDLPQYKIFCLIVWGKMIECHGARTFFLAVSHGANTFFIDFRHVAFFFFTFWLTIIQYMSA